jgi:hypothetical protein
MKAELLVESSLFLDSLGRRPAQMRVVAIPCVMDSFFGLWGHLAKKTQGQLKRLKRGIVPGSGAASEPIGGPPATSSACLGSWRPQSRLAAAEAVAETGFDMRSHASDEKQ